VFNNRKAVYLAFKDPHQGAFLARILKEDWAAFPQPPETLYPAGTVVRITGWIGWYQGDPYIQVTRPAQIEILIPAFGNRERSGISPASAPPHSLSIR